MEQKKKLLGISFLLILYLSLLLVSITFQPSKTIGTIQTEGNEQFLNVGPGNNEVELLGPSDPKIQEISKANSPDESFLGETIKVNFDCGDVHCIEETNPFFLSDPYGDEVRKTQSQDPDWSSTATHQYNVSDADDDDFMSFWMYIQIPLSGIITNGVIHYSLFFNESDDNGNYYSDTWSGTKTVTNSYDTMSELRMRFVHNTNTATFSIFRFEILNPDTGDYNNMHYKGEPVVNGIAWVKMKLSYCYFTPDDKVVYTKIHYHYSGQTLMGTLDIQNEYMVSVIQIIKPDYLTYQGTTADCEVSNSTNTVLLNCLYGNYEVYYSKNMHELVPAFDWTSVFNISKDCDSRGGWITSGWDLEGYSANNTHSGRYAIRLQNNGTDETFGLNKFPNEQNLYGSQDILSISYSRVFFAYQIVNYVSGSVKFQYNNGTGSLYWANVTLDTSSINRWNEVYLENVYIWPVFYGNDHVFQFTSDNFNGTVLIDTFRVYGWTMEMYTVGHNVAMGEFRLMNLNGRNDPYLQNIRYDWYIKNWSSSTGIDVTLDHSSNYSEVFQTDNEGYGRFYSYENLSAHYQSSQSSQALGLIVEIENRNFTGYFNWFEPITWNDASYDQLKDPIETADYYVLDSKIRTTMFAVWLDDFFIGDQFTTGDMIFKNQTIGEHTLRIQEWGDSGGWFYQDEGIYVDQYNFRLEVYRDYTYEITEIKQYMVVIGISNQFGVGLPFETVKVYYNGTRLVFPYFYVNESSKVFIQVKDYFGTNLFNQTFTITEDMELDVSLNFYIVTFANEGDYPSEVIIEHNDTVGYNFTVYPQEQKEVYMIEGLYDYAVYYHQKEWIQTGEAGENEDLDTDPTLHFKDKFRITANLPTVVDVSSPMFGFVSLDQLQQMLQNIGALLFLLIILMAGAFINSGLGIFFKYFVHERTWARDVDKGKIQTRPSRWDWKFYRKLLRGF
ncbi:MAG: hypothetical protein ACFFCI_02220 [Promethearchaeota archaeon]